MSKKRSSDSKTSTGDPAPEFGLVPPTGELAKKPTGDRPPLEFTAPQPITPTASDKVSYKPMGWKGVDDFEEVDPDPALDFGAAKKIPQDDMDMTPMIDVVFLLLIFFVLTASFAVQKSIEQPPSQIDDPSTVYVEPKDEEEYVEVIIDQTNTYYVTTRDAEEVEAPSDREMMERMRDAKLSTGADRLIIRAHVDSLHHKVVKVWDAGNAIGMNRIQMRTTDEDF
jgi:biopolymer transport protein ExbD